MNIASTINKKVRQIAERPYTRELIRNADGTWFARIVEFPGCMTEGGTREEALTNLDDAMAAWVEVKLEDGEAIPEPLSVDNYSGKFMVRVTKSLHRDLARRADSEGVSLNAFISTKLAGIV